MMNGKNSAGVESAPETDIPTGLNRIKTRLVLLQEPQSSRDDADKVFDSRIPAKHKQVTGQGHGKLKVNGPREGNRNAKKIARWFKLLFRDHSNSKDYNDAPQNTKFSEPDVKRFSKECSKSKLQEVGICSTSGQSAAQNISFTKGPKGMKSFSQELGPKGGIRPVYTRSHSFDNLKELLGSLRSRFDAAKEMVNVELSCFVGEVIELFQKNEFSSPKAQIFVDDLLLICQQCVEMTPLELRSQCETIVQDLTEKRKQCQTGLLKWLSTRMLFILTRCTRLLHFEKGSEQLDENSLHKFKKCLDSVPRVEMNWEPEPVIGGSSPCYPLDLKKDSKYKLQELSKVSNTPETPSCRPSIPSDGCSSMLRKDYLRADSSMLRKDYLRADHTLSSERPQFNLLSSVPEHRHSVGSYLNEPMDKASYSLPEKETSLDGCDSVLCRICEEVVPTPHLEFHSYICAYAEKCDLRCWDIDDRLSKLAEMLELIIESLNSSIHASYDSPESSRIQTFSPATPSDVCSPNVSEWRNKGVEGMFEDIHEMDTACIDDSVLSGTNMRSHLNMKLGHCGPPSSAGSITSCSSTNTPKTGLFDFFWLDGNIPSELEDVQQMSELVDIARCIAGTYLSKEGSHEVLLACMEDLQDVLQQSKVKALVVDTFGGRIESLLREKYINACDLMDEKCLKSNGSQGENSKVDTASPSSVTSTPQHPSHKERTSIEDFEIIKPISRGAFGKVYLARKRTTGDYFAIKVLKKLHMIRKNDIERILAERNILITARSTFVVRFFYSFTSKDNLYLVMEYLNGGDLYSLLRKVGCLDEDIARIYIAELVLALEYLQSLGIVHRDLKPDNILIAHDGHIKLTDFGLSKIGLMNSTGDLPGPNTDENTISDACGEQTVRTQDNSQRSAVGTPDYLAPEILLGTEHGYAADWWSVGIILFEFITGIPPFTAHCPEIIFDNILNRKIPWPSSPNDMSTEAQDLINRFLVHDPDQRLGSKGSWEVKAHPFFEGVNWDTLALQKAAFVPQLDSVDDTSYFVPRYSRFSAEAPQSSSYCDDSASEVSDSSNNGVEKMDECGALEQFDSTVCLSLMNFSFKNLSQLASINHDVLLQNGKDQSRYTSSSRDPNV